MAVKASRVLLTGAPTLVSAHTEDDDDFKPGWSVAVFNPGPESVFLGDENVNGNDGFELLAGLTFAADMGRGDWLYGQVTDAVEQEVHVIEVGVI